MSTKRFVALLVGALLLAGLSGPADALAPDGVSGRLIAPGGSAQAGALVRLLDMSTGSVVDTTSGPDGTFAFAGAQRPAKFVVQVCQNLAEDPCLNPSVNLDFVKLYVGPAEQEFSLPALTSYFVTDESSPAVTLGNVQLTTPGTLTVVIRNGLALSSRRLVDVSSMRLPCTRRNLTFRGLAPGRHLVQAFGQRKLVTVGAGQFASTVISERQPAVTGKVVLDGRPLRNVPVTLSGASDTAPSGAILTTRTGAHGRYAFRGLPFATTPWRLRIGAARTPAGNHTLVPGTPHMFEKFRLIGDRFKTFDLVTRSTQRGSLRIRLANQPPGSSRRVVLYQPSELIGHLPIRQDGSLVRGLEPGTYYAAAYWTTPDNVQRADVAPVRVGRQRTAQLTLSPPMGPGTVTVTAPPGSQVLAVAGFPMTPEVRAYTATRVVPASGVVVFDDLPIGGYLFYMYPHDNRAVETGEIAVKGPGVQALDLSTPSPKGSIRGQLVNPATGQPWPWTRVVARSVECDARGIYGRYDSDPRALLEDGGFIVVGGLLSFGYTCRLGGLRIDRGTPYPATDNPFHPITGDYFVTEGQKLERDFPVPFARNAG